MTGTQRFNLALRAQHFSDESRLVKLHQQLARHSVGYVADGVVGIPHVTLCQFSLDRFLLSQIGEMLSALPQEMNVTLMETRQRIGYGRHHGFDWIEIQVAKDDCLTTVQEGLCRKVQALGGDLHTQSGASYQPHITVARVACDIHLDLPQDMSGYVLACSPAWFECSANGECVRQIAL